MKYFYSRLCASPQTKRNPIHKPRFAAVAFPSALFAAAFLAGCAEKPKPDPAAEVPPASSVITTGDVNTLKVDRPEQFPTVAAGKLSEAETLSVTGTVAPDVSHNIPVVSLASGRVVEINAKLGDTVQKGQLLLRVQSADLSSAFATYRSAVADEKLASTQLDRSKLLFDKGALAQKDLEVAEDTEVKAKIAIENALEQIKVLGADVNHPSSTVDILAPTSGVITEQNVTAAAGVKTLDNSPNLFTISDLSSVWILCDVYENDLSSVQVGETVGIRLNAYPDRVFNGRVALINPILDPNTRTAKVRIEMPNPGMMRIGMFVDATFHGTQSKTEATVPATAVLHLHDRDWVYEPSGANTFRRVEVVGGPILPSKQQIIASGLAPGDKVVANALEMQNTVEQ
jgi:cobalt-zinc-cadmium efflux system membrane fusion protein